jgi:hypothetical protein
MRDTVSWDFSGDASVSPHRGSTTSALPQVVAEPLGDHRQARHGPRPDEAARAERRTVTYIDIEIDT